MRRILSRRFTGRNVPRTKGARIGDSRAIPGPFVYIPLSYVTVAWYSRHVWKLLRQTFGFVGLLGDAYTLVQLFAPPTVLGAVTFVFALGDGLHLAILIATTVFAMTTVGLYYGLLLYRENIVFGRLSTSPLGVLHYYADPETKEFNITLATNFMNASKKDIYASVRRELHSLAGRLDHPETSLPIIHLAPGHLAHFVFSTLTNIPVPASQATGRVELELHYGPSPDNLRYMLHVESTPKLSAHWSGDECKGLNFFGPWEKSRHTKA